MLEKKIFISCGVRTPIGSFQGSLKSLTAVQLASETIKQLIIKNNIPSDLIDSVILGNVVTSGIGQAPAKQASIFAGLSNSIPCSTVNKVCGSGLYSVILGINEVLIGTSKVVISGGMESMSNIPYLFKNIRENLKFGNKTIIDGMLHDGLIDPYTNKHMGEFGEMCAKKWNISREEQDIFSEISYNNALGAQKQALFKNEIIPLNVKHKKNSIVIYDDEEPIKFSPNKIRQLKPAFVQEGSVTAFNSSKLSDGAASLIVSDSSFHKLMNITPYFEVIDTNIFSHSPECFTTAPTQSIKNLLKKNNLDVDDVGLFEINEAFSVVPLHAMKEIKIRRSKLNIYGGAISLGHPLGCSGTRILVTLMNAMAHKNVEIGCASICLGGGEAISILIKQVF